MNPKKKIFWKVEHSKMFFLLFDDCYIFPLLTNFVTKMKKLNEFVSIGMLIFNFSCFKRMQHYFFVWFNLVCRFSASLELLESGRDLLALARAGDLSVRRHFTTPRQRL